MNAFYVIVCAEALECRKLGIGTFNALIYSLLSGFIYLTYLYESGIKILDLLRHDAELESP